MSASIPPEPMIPPLTDFAALLGIDLVLSAGCLRLLSRGRVASAPAKWGTALFSIGLWLPVGVAHLPLLAYVRGVSSDLSVTLVALACFGAYRCWRGLPPAAWRERMALHAAIALAAIFLYPMALGWGDWDSYRSGWGAWGMWAALLAVASLAWLNALRLVPVLVAMALLAWSLGLMESTNLWDYLIDPWLAAVSLYQCLTWSARVLRSRFRPATSSTASS